MKIIDFQGFSSILEDFMKFVEPITTVDHAGLLQRVFPLGNERFGSVSERLN